MSWSGLASWLDDEPLAAPDVAAAILDTHGPSGLKAVIAHLQDPGGLCLATAELAAHGESPADIGSARQWPTAALAHGVGPGLAHRLLALGVDVDDLAIAAVSQERARLIDLTQKIQEPRIQWDSGTVVPG